jgi:hypothetical protein
MAFNAVSTFTVQNEVDKVRAFAEIEPIFNIGGYTNEPALTIATDVFTDICGVNFPHKWNERNLPLFYTNSWQQDYALVNPDGSSVTNVEWLERGVAFDINSGTTPKPWVTVECGRMQPQRSGSFANLGTQMGNPGFIVNSLPNYSLYYGVWGQVNVGNPTLGNNPVAGSVYTPPLGAKAMPVNPITQIIDAQGNFLLLTTYGTEGTAAPMAPLNALPGTTVVGGGPAVVLTQVTVTGATTTYTGTITGGASNKFLGITFVASLFTNAGNNVSFVVLASTATTLTCATTTQVNETPPGAPASASPIATTVWTVVDPNGMGIRILAVPSQTGLVWQFNLVGQKPPVKFLSLGQLLSPLPDKYEPFFRSGFVAQCYKYSPEAKIRAKFQDMYKLWLKSLDGLREVEDRELEEYGFVLDRTVMGRGSSRAKFQGPQWPFNLPR